MDSRRRAGAFPTVRGVRGANRLRIQLRKVMVVSSTKGGRQGDRGSCRRSTCSAGPDRLRQVVSGVPRAAGDGACRKVTVETARKADTKKGKESRRQMSGDPACPGRAQRQRRISRQG